MTRLIDADALTLRSEMVLIRYGKGCLQERLAVRYEDIENAPTIDAVPSETLYDFIREIGAITYGKERFFHEEIGVHCGLWYDRKSGEWITTKTATEECLKAVRELDDGVLDEVPVKRGKWIVWDEIVAGIYHTVSECSECGFTTDKMSREEMPYCPNCGARNDKDE